MQNIQPNPPMWHHRKILQAVMWKAWILLDSAGLALETLQKRGRSCQTPLHKGGTLQYQTLHRHPSTRSLRWLEVLSLCARPLSCPTPEGSYDRCQGYCLKIACETETLQVKDVGLNDLWSTASNELRMLLLASCEQHCMYWSASQCKIKVWFADLVKASCRLSAIVQRAKILAIQCVHSSFQVWSVRLFCSFVAMVQYSSLIHHSWSPNLCQGHKIIVQSDRFRQLTQALYFSQNVVSRGYEWPICRTAKSSSPIIKSHTVTKTARRFSHPQQGWNSVFGPQITVDSSDQSKASVPGMRSFEHSCCSASNTHHWCPVQSHTKHKLALF